MIYWDARQLPLRSFLWKVHNGGAKCKHMPENPLPTAARFSAHSCVISLKAKNQPMRHPSLAFGGGLLGCWVSVPDSTRKALVALQTGGMTMDRKHRLPIWQNHCPHQGRHSLKNANAMPAIQIESVNHSRKSQKRVAG